MNIRVSQIGAEFAESTHSLVMCDCQDRRISMRGRNVCNSESRNVVGQLGFSNLYLNLLEGLVGALSRLVLHIGRLVINLLALTAARLGRGVSLLRLRRTIVTSSSIGVVLGGGSVGIVKLAELLLRLWVHGARAGYRDLSLVGQALEVDLDWRSVRYGV